MEASKRSRTIDIPAIMRAIHQREDAEPKLLVDPIAAILVDLASADPNWLAPLLSHAFAPQWRAGFLIRSRYAEDCLQEAAKRGLVQYLILGAGLDTFSYRQPPWAQALRLFEIDHPATQRFKRERLASSGLDEPANLTFVPVDLETTTLQGALRVSGFRFDEPTYCSWLGTTQYLTGAAVESTLMFVLSLPRGSEIVFSFILPQEELSGIEADALATAAAKAAEVGEPWLSRFHPADLVQWLGRLGFSEVVHLTPELAHERYLKGRRDGLRGRRGEQLIRAVT